VKFGENDAGEVEPAIELASHVHRFLARHRVDNEQDLQRAGGSLQPLQFQHEVLVYLVTSGGVEDHRSVTDAARLLDGGRGDRHGVGGSTYGRTRARAPPRRYTP